MGEVVDGHTLDADLAIRDAFVDDCEYGGRDHDDCRHAADARRAVTVLHGLGWRPNLAELEAENARLRDAVDSLTRDRNLLREKMRGQPAP